MLTRPPGVVSPPLGICRPRQKSTQGEIRMTRLIAVAAAVAALTGVGTSAASLVPGISDPGNTGCVNATFTLASTSQCQGGSPRLNVETTTGFYFLGCNNVIPVGNTYTFTAATIAAGGNQVPVPTGDIVSVSVLIDVEGTADLSDITVNGQLQVPAMPMTKDDCKNGGWQTFASRAFKNQGDCVSWVATKGKNAPNG